MDASGETPERAPGVALLNGYGLEILDYGGVKGPLALRVSFPTQGFSPLGFGS